MDEAEDIEDPVTKCKQCGTTWTPLWRTFGSEILCVSNDLLCISSSLRRFSLLLTLSLYLFSLKNACGLRRIRSRNGSGSKKRGRKKKKGMPAPKSTLKSSSYPRKPKVKSIFQTSKQLQSDTTGEIRRGKRERKTNTWFQQYETDLHHPQDENETSSEENGMELLAHEGGRKGKENQDYRSRSLSVVIPRRSHHHHSRKQSAARKEMVQDEDVKEACEALAAMDDRGDDSPESTSKSEELDLSDGEVDLILKLHDVYGPYKQSLLSDTIKRPECSTITLAIVLRGAQNLSRVGKISSPEKMWLLQKIASDDDSYLKSLPVACSNYDELEDLLYQFVLKERGESIEKASSFNVTQIDQKQPEVQVLPSAVIREPTTTPKMVPPPLYINEGIMADNYLNDIVKKLIVHTPKLEEEAPRLHLNFM